MLLKNILIQKFIAPLYIVTLFLLLTFSPASSESELNGTTIIGAEIHSLSNQELLKLAQTILDKANNPFLSQLRNLAKDEMFLEQNNQNIKDLTLPEQSLSGTRLTLEETQNKLDSFSSKLALLETKKELLDSYIENIATSQLLADNVTKTLEELKLFSLELSLRINDRTLRQIPSSINERSLKILKTNTLSKLVTLQQKAKTAQQKQETTTAEIEDTKSTINELEAQYTSLQEIYERELKQKQLELEHSEKTPTELP